MLMSLSSVAFRQLCEKTFFAYPQELSSQLGIMISRLNFWSSSYVHIQHKDLEI